MSESFAFDNVDHLTFGAVGEPGHRAFYVQAALGAELVSLKIEKQQVSALCGYIAGLLADLPSPGHLPEDLSLREPVDVAWIVGAISVIYEDTDDRFVLELEEVEASGDLMEEGAVARFTATREQCAALIIHGTSLVESGRPPCPLCGYPLDPAGHACPRTNGHRPPAL